MTTLQFLMECWQAFLKWPPQNLVLLISTLFAAAFAWKRYSVADSELRHNQFRQAANLLSDQSTCKNLYLSRTASVATLSFLAKKNPKTYHVIVMRLFEAFLRFPTAYRGSYGDRNPYGIVAPDSSETAEIIRFIEHRNTTQLNAERNASYCFELTDPSPFEFKNNKIMLKPNPLNRVREWCKEQNITSQFLKTRHPD